MPVNRMKLSQTGLPLLPALFFSLLLCGITTNMSAADSSSCSSGGEVKPTSPLVSFLERLQSAALQTLGPASFDPKLYVDLPLKHSLPAVESAFAALPKSARNGSIPAPDLERFVKEWFGEAGSDMLYVVPVDFVAQPKGFLPKVENRKVRAWALEVHSLWRNLSRKVSDRVEEFPKQHTLLPLPEPVVMPGSRFREVYYWDSYWIIRYLVKGRRAILGQKGLLASKMYESAKGIVGNLLSLVKVYGFIPNGARSYYSNRSQPPLLSSMILEVYLRTGDLDLLERSLPSLLIEYNFWTSGMHQVTIQDSQGCNHSASRYYAMWNKPRPESATIDEKSASNMTNIKEKESFYREVASAAESGWDFSSRWMRNSSDLTTLATTSIIPVDLNAYILKMESDIAFFAKLVGDSSTSKKFLAKSQARKAAINSILWNDEMDQWLDYWLPNNNCVELHKWDSRNQNHNVFASNFIPIWIEKFHSDAAMAERVLKSFQSSGLLRSAGIATSLSNSGQQWDFPNGWAPIQHMIVEGFAKSDSKENRLMAEDIVRRWIKTSYATYRKTGGMHEKYDVEACGSFGKGGEYTPQTGFGWSNGVVLAFLEDFGWTEDQEIDCK